MQRWLLAAVLVLTACGGSSGDLPVPNADCEADGDVAYICGVINPEDVHPPFRTRISSSRRATAAAAASTSSATATGRGCRCIRPPIRGCGTTPARTRTAPARSTPRRAISSTPTG